jgi:PAS domain S-box-containing protein
MSNDTASKLKQENKVLRARLEKYEHISGLFSNSKELPEKGPEFIESLLNTAQVIILVLDTQGKIVLFNKYLENISGYTLDEAIGKDWVSTFLPRKFHSKIKTWFKQSQSGQLSPANVYPIVTKAGHEVCIEWSDCKINEADTKSSGLLLTGHDITKRIRAEEELKTLVAATEQSPISIVITDPQGKIEYVNPKFCQLTGYTAEEVWGENPRILKSGEMPDDVYSEMWRSISSGIEWRGEFHNKTKSGELYWEDVVISPILDEDRRITHFLAVKENITSQKQAEMDKAVLEKQLRKAQKLETIGTLAGGIAHDFNNILAPIMGYTDMVLHSLSPTDTMYKDLEHVLSGARRAKDLIEQILLFSKQGEKERQPLVLQPLIREVLKLIRPSIPTTVVIRQQMDVNCGKVNADATQIHQIIVNLCTNAWQAMEEVGGSLNLELEQVKIDAPTAKLYPALHIGDYACLSVIDTGPGMDELTLDRIFEPFFTTKALDKGTGLGLSVVHGIVQNHHGDIQVVSKSGVGTAFHIYLPIIDAEIAVMASEPEKIIGGTEHIIVVDDEPAITEMLRRMLGKFGYTTEVYNSANLALDAFKQEPGKYDLLITDLTMPHMTGLDLAAQVIKISPGFPIVVMTGFSDKMAYVNLDSYGIQQILGKPIVVKEITATVRQTIDNKFNGE